MDRATQKALQKMARHKARRWPWVARLVANNRRGVWEALEAQCLLLGPVLWIMAILFLGESAFMTALFVILAAVSALLGLTSKAVGYLVRRKTIQIGREKRFQEVVSMLREKPIMRAHVLRWLDESQDGSLSEHELGLIENTAEAFRRESGDYPPAYVWQEVDPMVLDEVFYASFPKAPRFDETTVFASQSFASQCTFLNNTLGHVDQARARLRAETLGAIWEAPLAPTPSGRTRF